MIFEGSRYLQGSVVPVADSDGVYHATIIPADETGIPAGFSTAVTSVGDTFQSLALAAFGDPEQWWRVADANPEIFYPGVIPPGSYVRIPNVSSVI